jgi:hypothetical protein
MILRIQQVAGALLTLSAAYVGVWALADPVSFNGDFPIPGHHWVSSAGPYNEHLIRDVGGLYLALGIVTLWSVIRPRRDLLAAAGIAWEVFSVPHLLFHADHLDGLKTFDKVAETASLGLTVLLAALLLLPSRGSQR